MPDIETKAGDLFTNLKDYISTSVELLRLKLIQKLVVILPSAFSSLLLIGIFLMMFLLLSIGVSLYLGELLGATYYGFFLMGGIYLLAGIILMALKRRILIAPLSNWLIKNLMN